MGQLESTLACGEDGAPVFSTPRARANPSCSPTLACGEDGAPAFSTPRARANPSCSPTLACGEDGAPAFSITTCACKPQLQSHPRLRRGWGTHVLYYHVRVQTPVAVPPSLAARMRHPCSLLPRARADSSWRPTLGCGRGWGTRVLHYHVLVQIRPEL